MNHLKNVETSSPRQMKGMTLLPIDFIASDEDVICGRGSNCFNHTGNRKFRQIIDSNLIQYANSLTKFEKTTMICNIVNYIRTNSPTGTGFVKKDLDSGRYFDVGDYMAREKTSQAFRDALNDRCKRSNKGNHSRQDLHHSRSAPVMPSEDRLHLNDSTTMLLSNPNVNTMNHVNTSFRTMESPVTNKLIATTNSLKDYLPNSISLTNDERKMINARENTHHNQQKVKKQQNNILNLQDQELNNVIDITCTMFSEEKHHLDDNDSGILDMDDSRRIVDDDPISFHNDNSILFNSSKRQSCPTFLQGFSSSTMPMNVQSLSNDNWNEFNTSNVALHSNGYDKNNTFRQSLAQQNKDNNNLISNASQLERIGGCLPLTLNDSGRASIAPEDTGSSSTACGKQNILLEIMKQQSRNSPQMFPNSNNIHQISSSSSWFESNHVSNVDTTTVSRSTITNCQQQQPIDNNIDTTVAQQNESEENGKLFARLLEAISPYIHDNSNNGMDTASVDSIPPDSFEPNPL